MQDGGSRPGTRQKYMSRLRAKCGTLFGMNGAAELHRHFPAISSVSMWQHTCTLAVPLQAGMFCESLHLSGSISGPCSVAQVHVLQAQLTLSEQISRTRS